MPYGRILTDNKDSAAGDYGVPSLSSRGEPSQLLRNFVNLSFIFSTVQDRLTDVCQGSTLGSVNFDKCESVLKTCFTGSWPQRRRNYVKGIYYIIMIWGNSTVLTDSFLLNHKRKIAVFPADLVLILLYHILFLKIDNIYKNIIKLAINRKK